MQVLGDVCCLLLILSSLGSSDGTEHGCETWSISGTTDVCCQKCKPGNRLVKRCGPDPSLLCTPCEPQTYTINPLEFFCLSCTQCIGIQVEKVACTSSSDAVCGCATGHRCGNDRCSNCVEECGKGQEPTEKRTCQDCPEGKFNDKIHHKCLPRRTSCPDPRETIVASGDAFSDNKCNISQVKITGQVSHTGQKETNDGTKLLALVIAVITSLFGLVIFVSLLVCVVTRRNNRTKMAAKEPKLETAKKTEFETITEPRTMEVEQEDCSFCHPQQEQGGSSESIMSQDSAAKLLSV